MPEPMQHSEPGARVTQSPGVPINLAEAVESYRTYLTAVARASMGTSLNAKVAPSDLVQETFLAARRTADDFRGGSEAQLKAWLRSIMIHLVSNTRRHYHAVDRRRVTLEIPIQQAGRHLEDAATSVAGRAIRGERDAVMAMAIAQLPENHRRILEGHNRDGKTFPEISRELGISPGAARQQWVRALSRLRQLLEEAT